MRKTTHPAGTVHRIVRRERGAEGQPAGRSDRRGPSTSTCRPASDGAGLPLLVDLVGFTAGGPVHTNWIGFRENVPERLDRLIGEGQMPPVVVAFPDCFTRVGGNQYVNSAATGRWADFLTTELLAGRRGPLRLRRDRAARRLRQELRRLRRDRACARPSRRLGRGRLPLRRHGVRALLPARHAGHAARARPGRGLASRPGGRSSRPRRRRPSTRSRR